VRNSSAQADVISIHSSTHLRLTSNVQYAQCAMFAFVVIVRVPCRFRACTCIYMCVDLRDPVRDFVRLARRRPLWGRDTGCMLKPFATLFSFYTDQRRHTITKLTNGTRSVDPQDASKIRAHIGRIWYIRLVSECSQTHLLPSTRSEWR
jgi:hypothetical protein